MSSVSANAERMAFAEAGMNGSETTEYRWIRFIAVRSVSAAASGSVLISSQGAFSSR